MLNRCLQVAFAAFLIGLILVPRNVDAAETIDVESMAKEIAQGGIGTVGRVSESTAGPIVVVFEETHTSRVGQIEIAIMILRLYQHGMRDMAVEGYVRGMEDKAEWLRHLPISTEEKLHVATQLLEEGEINAPEYVALLSRHIKAHPIEKADEYSVELEEDAGAAPTAYLFKIGLTSMLNNLDPEQLRKVQALQEKKKIKELIEYVIDADPWTAEMSKKFTPTKGSVTQVEELVEMMDAIETKAKEVGFTPQAEERRMMENCRRFFRVAGDRSKTMAAATVTMAAATAAIANDNPRRPTVLIIGAAHTNRVCGLLDEHDVTYVVIRPQSFQDHDEKGDLSLRAFERKQKGFSVDWDGLGSLLDSRKKESFSPSAPHKKTKAELYATIRKIVKAANNGGQPPFGLDYASLDFGSTRVVPGTLERSGEDVIFQVEVFADEPGRKLPIWVRAKDTGGPVMLPETENSNAKIAEKMLLDARKRLKESDVTDEPDSEQNPDRSKAPIDKLSPLLQISFDMIATVSTSETAIRTNPL